MSELQSRKGADWIAKRSGSSSEPGLCQSVQQEELVFFFSLQALSMFSAALASGQLGPLMSQFGLPTEAVDAANKGGKCAFCSPLRFLSE